MRVSSERLIVGAALALSAATLVVQAGVLRPHLWPAGAGLAVSGENVMGTLAGPQPVAVIRPPDVRGAAGMPVTVTRVWPGGSADRAGIREGDAVRRLPAAPSDVLHVWRDVQGLRPGAPLTLDVIATATGASHTVVPDQPAIWSLDGEAWGSW